jgi:hypothetical protein
MPYVTHCRDNVPRRSLAGVPNRRSAPVDGRNPDKPDEAESWVGRSMGGLNLLGGSVVLSVSSGVEFPCISQIWMQVAIPIDFDDLMTTGKDHIFTCAKHQFAI